MRLDGQYDARADIARLRFQDYAGAAIDEETDPDLLRAFDPPTGRTVGVEVKHAREHLPGEFLEMLDLAPQVERELRASGRRCARQSGLGHHRTLTQLHDAWG